MAYRTRSSSDRFEEDYLSRGGEIHHLNGNHSTLPHPVGIESPYVTNADRYTTNKNGQWNETYNENDSRQMSGNSQRGSRSALLSVKNDKYKWPKGKDFLFSTLSFTIAAHSLWEFPLLVLKYGGIVFIVIYLLLFLLTGVPMLLLEMTLGQYSGLSPTKLFRNIAPILTGVGFAIVSSLIIQTLDDLAIIMWSSQGLYNLFSNRRLSGEDSFFDQNVLNGYKDNDLGNLGMLNGQSVLCLGIVCFIVFLFIALSTKSLGKVSILIVVLCYGLLVTLTIRGFMANGAWTGVYKLLTPRWEYLNKPWVWLEAIKHVFISLQLGLGVVSTYASFNKFQHNIIRDAGIIATGHFFWSIFCMFLVFTLLGVADGHEHIHIENFSDPDKVVPIIGKGFWFIGKTLIESSIVHLEYPWLWSGLLFCLIVLMSISTIMGTIETLSTIVIDEYPSIKQYKPAISFTFLSITFMTNLLLATEGGIYIYYLLTTYYAVWPLILYGLLEVLASAYAHGCKYLMKDIGDMSKMSLSHYISSHLTVIYSSVLPLGLACTLAWSLYSISLVEGIQSLKNFSIELPPSWGMPLGWSITIIPILLIILGIIFHIAWMGQGQPFLKHVRCSFKPTDLWYENEHKELMVLDASPKGSPLMAFKRGYKGGGNITEV
uniref:Sodium-dependent nutrient amino acid transporter 1 n=1 Tax=Lepeophtheirus salmonis TaxID=72036 RepID=A0A0K2TLA7_LEPSM